LLEVSDFAQFRSFDRPKILPGVDDSLGPKEPQIWPI
jgi:hypothetical protein